MGGMRSRAGSCQRRYLGNRTGCTQPPSTPIHYFVQDRGTRHVRWSQPYRNPGCPCWCQPDCPACSCFVGTTQPAIIFSPLQPVCCSRSGGQPGGFAAGGNPPGNLYLPGLPKRNRKAPRPSLWFSHHPQARAALVEQRLGEYSLHTQRSPPGGGNAGDKSCNGYKTSYIQNHTLNRNSLIIPICWLCGNHSSNLHPRW